MKIEANIDLDAFREALDSSKKITGDEDYFTTLSGIQAIKKDVKDVLEQVESLEAEAKGLIDNKAKALLGDNWQVIDGEKVKIVKSPTGSVYELTDTASPKFIITKKSVNTDEVDAFVEKNAKLPKGIMLNPKRGSSIRINLK